MRPPNSSHTPAEKTEILRRFVKARKPLYRDRFDFNCEHPLFFLYLERYDFEETDLNCIGWRAADLCNANLKRANAGGAILVCADLRDAKLTGAEIGGCNLAGADLRGCDLGGTTGFPASVHNALIDVHTFAISGWTVSDLTRWQTAGALIVGPDRFPMAAAALIPGSHAESPTVFISYGSCDAYKAAGIAENLESRGTRVWFAEWDLDAGDDIVGEIQVAIDQCETFIVLASAESIGRPWVRQELSGAMMRAVDDPNRLVIPVTIGDPELPVFLATRRKVELVEPYTQVYEDLARRVRREPRMRSRS